MSARRNMKIGVMLAGLACLMVSFAQAQQIRDRIRERQNPNRSQYRTEAPAHEQPTGQYDRPRQASHNEPTAAGNAGREVENFLANCLATQNQGEIELNEWAQSKAESPEVKQFAEQMVQDHRELGQRLQRVAGQPTTNNEALNRLAQIERNIAQQCGQMVRQELQQKSGAEFDQCYLGAQIGAHTHMLAALEVIQQQTGGELRQVAGEAQPVVKSHLQHAKELAQQMTEAQSQAGRERTQR